MPPTVIANTTDNNPVIVAHEVIIEGTPPKPETLRGPEEPAPPQNPQVQTREFYEERSEKRLNKMMKSQVYELLKMKDSTHKHDVISLGINALFIKLDQTRDAEPQKREPILQDATFFMVHLRKVQGDTALTNRDREDISRALQRYTETVKEMKPEDGAELAKSIVLLSGGPKNWNSDESSYHSISNRAGLDLDLGVPYKRYALVRFSRFKERVLFERRSPETPVRPK